MTGQPFTLAVPPELVDAIADAVAAKLAANGLTSSAASPYLDVTAAAGYLCASSQRVYDLVHAGRLIPRRDGRRLLFAKADLDAYLQETT